MTKDEADELVRLGYTVCEDSGRGYRRTIPSPMPKEIVELDVIKTLVNSGAVVIAAGGGGIPRRQGGRKPPERRGRRHRQGLRELSYGQGA